MDWINVVQSVGFPICMVGAMGWYIKNMTDKNDAKVERQAIYYQEQIDKLERGHKESMEKITEALNNNTIALTKLTERLEVNEDDE